MHETPRPSSGKLAGLAGVLTGVATGLAAAVVAGAAIAQQVGDHALAQPVDGIHAAGAGNGQHQADADEGHEVAVDEAAVVGGKAHIDHAPDGQRHCQHGRRRHHEGYQRRGQHPRVARKIGPEAQKRGQLAPAGL